MLPLIVKKATRNNKIKRIKTAIKQTNSNKNR